MPDQTLTCKDCGKQFTWTESEQEFYKQKGFNFPPARCPDCRRLKKQARQANRQMFPIKCAQCGKDAQVPFQPKGDKPVYCQECFQKNRQV